MNDEQYYDHLVRADGINDVPELEIEIIIRRDDEVQYRGTALSFDSAGELLGKLERHAINN